MDTLNPDDLLLFARVVEQGSFTAAAQALGLPKSTLSRRVTLLEARLGERLLLRTTRRLTLTDFGQAVLEHAQQVAAETASAWALAQHRQQEPGGRLRVSMPADLAELALAETLADYAQRYPQVELELDLSPRRVDLITESFDVALRMGDLPDDAHLAARKLAEFTSQLYAAPGWRAQGVPLTHPRELLEAGGGAAAGSNAGRVSSAAGAAGVAGVGRAAPRCLMVGTPGQPLRPWTLTCPSEHGPAQTWQGQPRRPVLANSPGLLLELARAGLGVALAPRQFAHRHVLAGELVPVLPEWRTAPVPAWAVFPGRRLMPAKTRAFIEMLADRLARCDALGGA